MFQCIIHSILIDRGCHIAGRVHHLFGSIAHGNSDPDMAKHLDIISAIAKGHAFVQTDMEMFQHLVNPDPLTASKRYDIRKKRIPPRGFTMGQNLHNSLFLLCRKKGDQLVNRLSVDILDRTDGRSREVQQMKHIVYGFIRIVHENLLFLHEGTRELAFHFLVTHQGFDILIGNTVLINHIVFPGKHIAAIQSHIAIKLKIAQIVNRTAVTAGCYKDFYPLLLQQLDRMKGGFRDYMCFKADQCPIYIKKE